MSATAAATKLPGRGRRSASHSSSSSSRRRPAAARSRIIDPPNSWSCCCHRWSWARAVAATASPTALHTHRRSSASVAAAAAAAAAARPPAVSSSCCHCDVVAWPAAAAAAAAISCSSAHALAACSPTAAIWAGIGPRTAASAPAQLSSGCRAARARSAEELPMVGAGGAGWVGWSACGSTVDHGRLKQAAMKSRKRSSAARTVWFVSSLVRRAAACAVPAISVLAPREQPPVGAARACLAHRPVRCLDDLLTASVELGTELPVIECIEVPIVPVQLAHRPVELGRGQPDV